MLKGDLVTTPLPAVLRQLADGVASGCLHIDDGVGGNARVYLRGGHVYAVQVPGKRPQLGARLVSSGALGPEALAEALEAQRTELQGWRLGELLVHLGYVDQPVVEAFVDEQLRESASDLLRWPTGTWKFRVNERTREDVAPPTPVEELLSAVEQRRQQWDAITEVLHGPDAVPVLSSAAETDAEMSIDPDAWSLLCKVDGVRTLADLARECGFTLFEAGQVVFTLVRNGLLEVEETVVGAETPPAAAEPESVVSRLAAAFAPAAAEDVVIPQQAEELAPSDIANLVANALREDRTLAAEAPAAEEVDASVDRVSEALSALLGDAPPSDDLFAAPRNRRPAKAKPAKPKTAAEIEREKRAAARAEAQEKRRAADAEELARAQSELEAARAAEEQERLARLAANHEAEIVSLEAARRAAEERAAAEEAARLEAERLEAERLAAEEAARAEADRLFAEEAARLEAERLEAERLAAEEHARAEAELRAAQEAEEAARLEAERIAAEAAEAERLRLEAEEAQRQADELAAAEERAKAEAEMRAAQAAEAAEAERLRAEQEAARLAAEAEEARLRQEAEEAEQARLAEQRLHASDAFAELSAAAATAGDTLVVEAPVQTEVDAEPAAEDVPAPVYPPADTDMASLFRELSSLGLEDDPAPPPVTPRPAPRPAAPSAASQPKKKKGLFGR